MDVTISSIKNWLSKAFMSVSLCVCLTSCDLVFGPELTSETIWTAEIIGKETTYVLRAPLGAFKILLESDINRRNRRSSAYSSIGMEWHYDTEEPLQTWLVRNGKTYGDDYKGLTTQVSVVNAGTDTAEIGKQIYFSDRLNNSNPNYVPKLQGKVWNKSADMYRSHSQTYYVINDRKPFDASVIVCRDSAFRCSLHGAKATETLSLEYVSIAKDDLVNWRQYQEKLQRLVRQSIVEEKPTENYERR